MNNGVNPLAKSMQMHFMHHGGAGQFIAARRRDAAEAQDSYSYSKCYYNVNTDKFYYLQCED